jgi:serine/threonine protein kinase
MSKYSTTTHPTKQLLQAFGLGQLSAPEQAELEKHIAECDVCCASLHDLPNDTLIERLRVGKTDPNISQAWPRVASANPSRAELRIPKDLLDHPRYRILKQLGAGGMGVVYQAEHRMMERQVALKVISRQLMNNPQAVDRFRQEVKAAGKLSHTNIVTAYDAEQAGDLHFLVMEYVDGVNLLDQVEKRGPLSVRNAANFIRQAALGLQHAADQGMVHRDIKPHNLMLTRDLRVKILDFGLSRFARENTVDAPLINPDNPTATAVASLTTAGMAIGTPDYIAPEQATDSRSSDIRADIYSLGCTFYFLLCGRPPFSQGTAAERIHAHLHTTPISIREIRPEIPEEIAAIISRMLAKDPQARYQKPSEVAQALAEFSKTRVVTETPKPDLAIFAELPNPTTALPSPAVKNTATAKPWSRLPMAMMIGSGTLLVLLLAMLATSRLGSSKDKLSVQKPSPPLVKALPVTPPPSVTPLILKNLRVLFVVPFENFWYQDYAKVNTQLAAKGIQDITIASKKTGYCQPGQDMRGGTQAIHASLALDQVDPNRFDVAIVIGANPLASTEYIANDQQRQIVKNFVNELLLRKKWVLGICGGNAILAETGILRDRPAAWNQYIPQPILKNSGAKWNYKQPVVSLGNYGVITAKDEDCAAELINTLINSLPESSQ